MRILVLMIDINSFLEDVAAARSPGPVLVFAHRLPDALTRYPGPVTFFGSQFPDKGMASQAANVIVRRSGEDLLQSFEAWARISRTPFSLVILDADHTIGAISQQINAALAWSDSETVFLLPGGAPTALDMAGPKPVQDWWMGEVWTLPKILEAAGPGFFAVTTDLAPIGLVAARDFKPLNLAEAAAKVARLHAETLTDEALLAGLRHVSAVELADLMGVKEPEILAGHVKVTVDPAAPDVLRSDVLDPQKPWLRPQPAFILDLSAEGVDTSGLNQQQRLMQGVSIDHFENTVLLGHDMFLSDPGEGNAARFYCRNSRADVSSSVLRSFGTRGKADGHNWQAPVIAGEDYSYVEQQALDAATPIDTPIYFATPDEHVNWGMWMLFNVPAAVHYQNYKRDYPRFFSFMGLGWQKSLLIDLGVDEAALMPQVDHELYRVKSMAVLRHSFRGMTLGDSDTAVFDGVAERYLAEAPGKTYPEKIFIVRPDQGGGPRMLINQAELIAALEALGFVTVQPEKLPFRDQVRLFRQARVIIGLGGAAMFNTVFCRPGVRIIDIESGMGFVDSHANIFASRGADYGVIIGDQDQSDPTYYHKRWTIDVARATAAIRAFID